MCYTVEEGGSVNWLHNKVQYKKSAISLRLQSNRKLYQLLKYQNTLFTFLLDISFLISFCFRNLKGLHFKGLLNVKDKFWWTSNLWQMPSKHFLNMILHLQENVVLLLLTMSVLNLKCVHCRVFTPVLSSLLDQTQLISVYNIAAPQQLWLSSTPSEPLSSQ